MTNQELKEYIDGKFKPLEPFIVEFAKMQGAVGLLKWVVTVGFLLTGIILTYLKE